MDIPKLAILSCAHGRPEVTEVFLDSLDRVVDRFYEEGIRAETFIGFTNGQNMDGWWCAEYYEFSNALVGQKHNLLLQASMEWGWDYMIQLGSDDLLLDSAIKQIAEEIKQGTEYWAFKELWVCNPKIRKIKYHVSHQPFGAGRGFSRQRVEQVLNTKGVFWTPEKQRGLDGDSGRRFSQVTNLWPKILAGAPVVDIKTKENLNGWHKFPHKEQEWQVLTPEMEELWKRIK